MAKSPTPSKSPSRKKAQTPSTSSTTSKALNAANLESLRAKAIASADRRYASTFLVIGRATPGSKLELFEVMTRSQGDETLRALLSDLVTSLNKQKGLA